MSSGERIPWQESNLALIGSDLDVKIRQAAAQHETQWAALGQDEKLHLWRMEDFQVVPWPHPGQFHIGDSYLVLHSYYDKDKDKDSRKLLHDVHIWIGAESSQDEYGTAAYKMVEADDALGGVAVQHRELQGHESQLFLSYFDHKLTYLQGGAASGFRHVEPTVEQPFLYRVKGTHRAMSLTQLPTTTASLNQGDSFILVLGKDKVILWNGIKANPDERNRANLLAESMATQGTVVVLDQNADQGEDDHEDAVSKEFWEALGGHTKDIADESSVEKDDMVEEFTPTLYRLGLTGEPPELIAEGEPIKIGSWGQPAPKIARSMLDAADVYLLDAGWELFVWMGAGADRSEKLAAMGHVDAYGKMYGRARHLPVTIVKSGYETNAFDGYFYEDD